MKPVLLILILGTLALLTAGCANNADTNAPQVEKSGSPKPPGVTGDTASRPQ